jgi:hypothetical protein
MTVIINICIVLFLVLIGIQDFKQRAISWFLIPLAFMALYFNASYSVSTNDLMKNFLVNITFVMLQLILLTGYFSLKNKHLINVLKEYIGLGDLLFFVVLCVAFSPVNFIVFFIMSLIGTLLGSVIYASFISKKVLTEIPLAGAMASILLIVIFLNKMTMHLDFYDDSHLLGLMNL